MAMIRYSPAWYINPGNPSSPLYPHNIHHNTIREACNTVTSYTPTQTHFSVEHFLLSIVLAVIIVIPIVFMINWKVKKEMREAEEKAEKEGYNTIWK